MNETKEKQKIEQKTTSLVSFDIFDTLVTRRVATPSGIFALMQDYLFRNNICDDFFNRNFYNIRIGAEELAHDIAKRQTGSSEVTFDNIYKLIGDNYNLSEYKVEELKKIETSLEFSNIVPIEKNIKLLKKYISENKHVVLISDMYFSSNVLKRLLLHIDPIFENIKIYVSCENQASKEIDGNIYKIVKEKEVCDYNNWQHYGDNRKADVIMAKKRGIKAKFLPKIELLNYEKLLLKNNESNVNFQISIGSAKLARMNQQEKNPEKYIFGCSFGAPILYNYVNFVINKALQQGFKTLHFIARDGYIPKLIADLIIKERGLSLNTKYIYGSRLAWRILSEYDYEKQIDWIFDEFENRINIDMINLRLGIDKSVLQELLSISSTIKPLKKRERCSLKDNLKNNQKLKSLVLEIAKNKELLLKQYFNQELDLSEGTIAFVDLYGTGKNQDSISKIINRPIYTFYLLNARYIETDLSKIISYLPTFKHLNYFVELLSKTADGQTLGYEEKNGNVIPILENANGINILKWGLNDYINGVLNYTKYILNAEKINNSNYNSTNLLTFYIEYIKSNLDKKTANILGSIPYTALGLEKKCLECAPKLSLIDILVYYFTGKQQKIIEFPEISYARSGIASKYLQDIIKECPTLQKFLFNIYIHKRNGEAYIRILGIKISLNNLYRRLLLDE